MRVKQAFKYRIYPTHAQYRVLCETLDTCRHLYNRFLDWRKTAYEETGSSPSYYEQKKALPEWKKENAFLASVHSQVLQDVALRVERAFGAFFRRVKAKGQAGYPRFKGRGWYDSFTYPQAAGFAVGQKSISLSKIGTLKAKIHRPCLGTPKTLTVRHQAGKWYACVVCEVEVEALPPSDEEVGIDVGLASFATLSNGEAIENPRFFRQEEKALAKAQRKLSKQPKGAASRKKARKVVGRIHERIRNRRCNFAHQVARRLVNRYGKLVVEDLNIKGMVRNHHLAKSICDAAWNQFRAVLSFKAASAGRIVIVVEPKHTSQDCSVCGYRVRKPLSERVHSCPHCGLVMDRDENAALNLLALGRQSVAASAA
jgi:putative transposase